MKKFFLSFLFVVLLLPVLGLLGVRLSWGTFVEPKIRSQIVTAAQEHGWSLFVQPLRWQSWFLPVQIQVTDLQLVQEKSGRRLLLPQATLQLAPRGWGFSLASLNLAINLVLQNPKIIWPAQEGTAELANAPAGSQKAKTGSLLLPPVGLSLVVSGGEVQTSQLSIKDLQLKGAWSQLDGQTPGTLKVTSQLEYDWPQLLFPVQGSAPLHVESQDLRLGWQRLQASALQLNFGGLVSQNQVEFLFNEGTGALQSQVVIQDLADLQKGGLLPPGTWRGGFSSELTLQQDSQQAMRASGRLQFKNIQGVLQKPVQQQGGKIGGGFSAQGMLSFAFQERLQKLQSQLRLDLTPLAIQKDKLFNKPAGVPLILQAKSSLQEDKIKISALQMQLAQVKAQLSGWLAPQAGQFSRLQVQVPKTSLAGLEKVFLPLKDYPIKGALALQSQIQGDLQNSKSLQVQVNPLDLQMATGVNYQNDKMQVQGPLQAKIQGQFAWGGQEVKSAQGRGQVNLNAITLKMPQGLQKSKQQKLQMDFQLEKKGKNLQISRWDIASFLGDFKIRGELAQPATPRLNLQAQVDKMNLQALKTSLKALAGLPVSGLVSGTLRVQGTYDNSQGIQKSPLRVSGKVLHNASLLRWQSKKSGTASATQAEGTELGGGSAQAAKISLQPLLPDWPVLKTAKLQLTSKIKRVIFNDLEVTDFILQGLYDQGVLTGAIRMEQIFSGSLQLKNMRSQLYQVPTYVEGEAVTQKLNLQQAVTWGVPTQKDLLKGALTGAFKVKTPFPSHGDPLLDTESSGALKIDGFEVSTIQLDQMVNGLLAKIPGLKNKKKLKTEKVKAFFQTQYRFKKGLLSYEKTRFITPENHELLASGDFHVNKQLNLQGRLFVSGIQVKENLRACLLDSQQRLEVPVEYHGLITQPKMTTATKAIEQVGGRYLKCEKNLQVQKAKTKAKEEANKVLKKEGKKLQESLQKKFKKIF